jgi:SHS2 domain-containing protein
MEKFKFFEHTADAKFQAYGNSLEEAFSNAALAMFSIMVDYNKVEAKIKKEINVSGNDLNALLYNFLEELLFLLDSESFLLNHIKKLSINKKDSIYHLNAITLGDEASDKYETKSEVKAVTYNEMEIHNKKPYSVQVVVDI